MTELEPSEVAVIHNLSILLLSLLTVGIYSSEAAPNYGALVGAYADAMIENGRDRYGQEHSPLFASALHRENMNVGRFPAIEGVREDDRSLTGANPQVDKDFYAILYRLSEKTGDKRYSHEADAALKFFFERCQSPQTGLMAWGEHLYWDFKKDAIGMGKDAHEIISEWPFWDVCYRLAPEASWLFAIGQWDHQIADKKTGDFSRHARWTKHGPGRGADFPRYAGQLIANWGDAYVRAENRARQRREELITGITCLVARMEANMNFSQTGHLVAGSEKKRRAYCWPTSNLELARCLWKTAPLMEEELAARMKTLAVQQDQHFLELPHTILEGGGFAVTIDSATGKPRVRSMNKPYTALWASGYGYGTHARPALACLIRMVQLAEARPDLATKYRPLVIAAANGYLHSEPDINSLLKPKSFSAVISLLLKAHELTADKRYLDRADHFGRQAVHIFIDDGKALPKASNRHDHYESITGGPSLMLSLLDLEEALGKR